MSRIGDAEDILSAARSYIECIFMAAADLEMEKTNAIQTVADMASQKINEAIAILDKCGDTNGDRPISDEPRAKNIQHAKPRARAA